uniref:Uncharacterized protein n=1 Tax=Cyclophora tenuis TaxID=216820 RepID=A0A7S1D398_CYCTE|mmetsp:Transcript_21051/g.35904  ORF Transcript_21051/g.35904 Transcript_21051/m.35904 type:complete len:175 (+) Transcript_21051:175-699(+)
MHNTEQEDSQAPNTVKILPKATSNESDPTESLSDLEEELPHQRTPPPRIDSRLPVLKKTLESQRAGLGRRHPRVASTLVALSMLRAESGLVDDAIETLLEAVMIQRDRSRPWELARSLHMLTEMYCRQREYDEAALPWLATMTYRNSSGSCMALTTKGFSAYGQNRDGDARPHL